jgi:hypothetical protein
MNSWCIPNLFSAPCLQLTSSVCSKSPVYFQASSTSMIRHLSAGLPALCRACLVVISIFDSALALLPVPFRPLLMLLPPTHPSASRATASVFSEQRATSCAPCPRGWSRACHGGRSRAWTAVCPWSTRCGGRAACGKGGGNARHTSRRKKCGEGFC